MKKGCSLCNDNDFILTFDGDIVSNPGDLTRIGIDCEKCDEIQKKACLEIIHTLRFHKEPKEEECFIPKIQEEEEKYQFYESNNTKKNRNRKKSKKF